MQKRASIRGKSVTKSAAMTNTKKDDLLEQHHTIGTVTKKTVKDSTYDTNDSIHRAVTQHCNRNYNRASIGTTGPRE